MNAFEKVHIMEVSSFRGLQKMGHHFIHSQLHCLSSYTLPAASTRWVGCKFTYMVCNYRRSDSSAVYFLWISVKKETSIRLILLLLALEGNKTAFGGTPVCSNEHYLVGIRGQKLTEESADNQPGNKHITPLQGMY